MGLISEAQIINLIKVIFGRQIAKYLSSPGGNSSGFVVWMRAQEDLVEGEYVMPGSIAATDGIPYCKKNAVDGVSGIGAVYTSTNVGELVPVIVGGLAYLLPESGVTAAQGYIAYSSNAEAGRVDQSNTAPDNGRVIGVFVETGSGAGVKALAVISKN